MPRRARPISKRSAISSAVSRSLAALPEGPARDATGDRTAIGPRPVAVHGRRFRISAEAAEAYARARELAEQRGDPRQLFMAVYGLWQSANGAGMILECRRLSDRLLQLTAGEADDGLRLQAHHSAWATCLFPASRRLRASTARRGAGSMIPSGTVSTAYSMAGTIPACAPATSVRRSIGCSAIPRRVWRSAAKHWHWPSGSLTRSASELPCSAMRCFTSIAASRNWRCNGLMRPRRWPPSNGSGSCWNRGSCAAPL